MRQQVWLHKNIRQTVRADLQRKLNSAGLNVTKQRLKTVMAALADRYGLANLTLGRVSSENRRFVKHLTRFHT